MKFWISLIVMTGLTAMLSVLAIFFIDKPVSSFFYYYLPPAWNNYLETAFMITSPLVIISISIGLLVTSFFIRKPIYRSILVFTGANVLVSMFLTLLLKITACRSRPELFIEEGIYRFGAFCFESVFHSFPSGHAVAVTTFLLSLMIVMKKVWLNLIGIILIPAAVLNRVVMNEHFLSDVMAGVALGALICFATARYAKNLNI